MSGGQFNVPLVIRMTTGAGRQLAAQHSHSLEGWYAHIPGIKVLAPGDARRRPRHARPGARRPRPGADLRARRALRHGRARSADAWRPSTSSAPPSAAPGSDVTLITYGGTWSKVLEAPRCWPPRASTPRWSTCASCGRSTPPRSLASVTRTHRAVVVDEGWRTGSLAAEVSARITEQAFCELDAPVARVCSAEVPMPYAKHLEEAALPSVPGSSPRSGRCLHGEAEFLMPSLGADMDDGHHRRVAGAPGRPRAPRRHRGRRRHRQGRRRRRDLRGRQHRRSSSSTAGRQGARGHPAGDPLRARPLRAHRLRLHPPWCRRRRTWSCGRRRCHVRRLLRSHRRSSIGRHRRSCGSSPLVSTST